MLFSDVRYFLSTTFPSQRQQELQAILDANDAKQVSLTEATHVITDTPQFEGCELVQNTEAVAILSDKWVDRSVVLGKQQEAKLYSPDPAMIFSGVIACTVDLTTSDREVISAGLSALGGLCRDGYTRDCTHLLAGQPGSEKYNAALHFQSSTRVHIVTPHWFDDCVKLFMRLDETPYAWPNPQILKGPPQDVSLDREKAHLPENRKEMIRSAFLTDAPKKVLESALAKVQTNIWGGRKILLGRGLNLDIGRRETVEISVQRAGGIIVCIPEGLDEEAGEEEEAEMVEEAGIYITKFRTGPAYLKALRARKTIGTLAWLFHVHKTGILTRPQDQLLHFPIRKQPIARFSTHKITISNYTGEARNYLKKLIELTGAEFTPTLTAANSIVIAAFIAGDKAAKAREWSIPIVNHTWLEDCFIQWKDLTPALDKYILFPEGVSFGSLVGGRGIGPIGSGPVFEEEIETLEQEILEQKERRAAKKRIIERRLSVSGRTTSETTKEINAEKESLIEKSVNDVAPMETKRKRGRPRKVDNYQGHKSKQSSLERAPAGTEISTNETSDAAEVEAAVGFDNEDKLVTSDAAVTLEAKVDTTKPKVYSSKRTVRRPAENVNVKESATVPPQITASKQRTQHPSISPYRRKTSGLTGTDNAEGEDTSDMEGESKEYLTPVKAGSHKLNRFKDTTTAQNAQLSNKLSRGSSISGPTPRKVVVVEIPVLAHRLSQSSLSEMVDTQSPSSSKMKTVTGLKRGNLTSAKTRLSSESDTGSMISPKPVLGSQAGHRPPSRRQAATIASLKLQEAGTDMLEYQRQVRSGVFRGPWEKKSSSSTDFMDEHKVIGGTAKKRRQSKEASHFEYVDSSDEDEQDKRDKKRLKAQKLSTKSPEKAMPESKPLAKRSKSSAIVQDTSEHLKIPSKSVKMANGKKASRGDEIANLDPKDCIVMTTQITLDESIQKNLVKLGMRLTTRPEECTILVAEHIGRTEKFLCSMASARYIVSKDWAAKCVSERQILPPAQFNLRDPEGERRYKFKLVDALKRAHSSQAKLLEGHQFYATRGLVSNANFNVYKNVIASVGGKILAQNPTARTLKGQKNRHVLSVPDDSAIWLPLAEDGFPIYHTELVIMGVLTHQMGWDNEGYRLDI